MNGDKVESYSIVSDNYLNKFTSDSSNPLNNGYVLMEEVDFKLKEKKPKKIDTTLEDRIKTIEQHLGL